MQGELGKLQKIVKAKKPAAEDELEKWQTKRTNAKEKLAVMQQEMKALRKVDLPGLEETMGVRDLPVTRDTHFRVRGDVARKGPLARRGFLPVISQHPHPEIPEDQSGRMQYADWIAAPNNPLTARVMANRIWKHLFGEGIVRTVDNFGATGERPSNPELLDYLAVQFIEHGWSVKQLIREIMLSRTYQLSSEYEDRLYAADPDNRLFGRMHHRRLDAEAIRDTILFASGALDLAPATASPVQKMGNVNIGQNTKLQAQLKGPMQNKRSVYLPVVRNLAAKFLTTFDFAESSIIVGRRDVTTVPTQALMMMNNPGLKKHARALAERLVKEEPTDREARLDRAYALTLCRLPVSSEREAFLKFLADFEDAELVDRWSLACQSLFASAEFRYLE